MKHPLILLFAGLLCGAATHAQVSFTKIDSTLKIGKVGYRVECKNKNVDVNQLTVRPIGFDGSAREVNFPLRGRLLKAEIDDLNNDGYPDLVLYIYTDSAATFGTVYVFLSEANKSITGCVLPDAMMDGKINTGYKGHDQFIPEMTRTSPPGAPGSYCIKWPKLTMVIMAPLIISTWSDHMIRIRLLRTRHYIWPCFCNLYQ
jgi:hypothetical protein